MARTRLSFQRIAIVAWVAAVAAGGCTSEERGGSSYLTGYTLSQDFELERRVLRVQRTADAPVECMQAALPVGTSPVWKRAPLDPATQRELIDLMLDEGRVQKYQADTEASIAAEVFLCGPRPSGGEFCYSPEFSISGAKTPSLFGLPPTEVELSPESRELIDAFLDAHAACWQGGEPVD